MQNLIRPPCGSNHFRYPYSIRPPLWLPIRGMLPCLLPRISCGLHSSSSSGPVNTPVPRRIPTRFCCRMSNCGPAPILLIRLPLPQPVYSLAHLSPSRSPLKKTVFVRSKSATVLHSIRTHAPSAALFAASCICELFPPCPIAPCARWGPSSTLYPLA